MEPIHIVGAIFVAYIVVKEVFVLVKGETKQIAKDMAEMKAALLTKGENNKNPVEQITDMYTAQDKCDNCRFNVDDIRDKVEDLHKWHDREDDEGVKIWYVRKSLEASIKKLPITLAEQRELMSSLVSLFEKLHADIDAFKETHIDKEPD